MNRLQFYKYAALGLLLLNLSMVAFFFLTAPPRHQGRLNGEKPGGKGAAEILKLEDSQNESFLNFAEAHMKQMEGFETQQRDLLNPYFQTLTKSDETTNSDSLLNQIQLLERNKIESTYQHFQDIKSILKPEQNADFEEFINHALLIILPENTNPRRPKGNRRK